MGKKKKGTTANSTQTKKTRKPGWHGGKKKDRVSFEGGQYQGGRKKGRKNLVKLDNGNLLNQNNIEFTIEEKKRLESLVNRANKIRVTMLEQEANLPRLKGGTPTGGTVRDLHSMGTESDFILTRKTKSLQRFKSKEDYEIYIQNLENVIRPEYIDERTRLYKRNHMKALKNVYGNQAKDVIMKIRMMKPEDYRKLLQSDEDMEINYIYDPSEAQGKLNAIRRAMGMKEKEDPIPDFVEIEEEW